ncbi:DUF1796 family putative cysteine peptidase [Oceanimonas sp. CAM02]|uniref:DUF1796 family putative cysteine peptidase n=1 Tax=Oceanimonas sp. CAM02 TaxID=3080336 RepID=UPI0029361F7E|nr:DUF1796 family putative cysteine peptidase [Oceanimonas sp. CAM02]MDV2857699.1 DUF1796 family putative cysteine peptidase [Oceanimonas sp. CAM02]
MTADKNIATLKRMLHENECEFVSLGYNCDVAHFLRYTGLRKAAYPFDWCIAPNDSVIKIIKNDFEGFMELDNITYSEPHKALVFEGEGGAVVESDKLVVTAYCEKYGMIFPHDFHDSNMFQVVKDKYNKRIERFLNIVMSGRTVVFVFKPEADENECAFNDDLINCLRIKFPKLDFYVCSLGELSEAVDSSLKISVLRFFNRKLVRFNSFVSSIIKLWH